MCVSVCVAHFPFPGLQVLTCQPLPRQSPAYMAAWQLRWAADVMGSEQEP